MPTFDLLHKPWVPVLVGGTRTEVSLADALGRAHELDGLAVDDALQAVAVLRQVLLPVVWDAVGVPRTDSEWARWWSIGRLDQDRICAYLAEHAERFDLFHQTQPFAQVGGLRTAKDETKPVSLLITAAAVGNNVPLFSARTEGNPPPLSPAEAARAVLTAHCWDTAAIKSGAVGDPKVKAGKTTGNPTGPLGQLGVVVPVGATLAETILLNTPIIPQGLRPQDRPQWRADIATPVWKPRPAAGLLDLLTWQARRIRLVPETLDDGQVVVRRVVLAAGDRLDPLPQEEPHTWWRQVDKPKPGDPPRRPMRHQPGKSAWRGLTSLLATRDPEADAPLSQKVSTSSLLRQLGDLQASDHVPADLRLQVLTVGVQYGNQSAVVEDVMVDAIPLPVAALAPDSAARQLLLDIADQAERLREAANRLGDDLRRAAGGNKLPWDRSQRLGDMLVYDFTPVVHRLLAGLQREPDRVDEAEWAWKTTARRLARAAVAPALAAAPPTAFLGRQETEHLAYRLSTAEARYRAALNAILGPAEDAPETLSPLSGATR
ncbi:MAG TPA: type I-E CRISPR-associated protein Cse1/CasA [Pseudonocardiaceae bacterium]|nr:type I-E CRISPR-associated protein Cse1/CasA [Pseudonocardiaceae bacterium]